MILFTQALKLKLWMLIALIAGTALISTWITTLSSSQSSSQIITCPPCKQASCPTHVKPPTNHNSYRVPNDDGKTY